MGHPSLKEITAKLTAKQRKFAEGLVYGGLSKAEAYRQAYKWDGKSQNGLRVNATRYAQKPNVKLAIEVMEQEKTARWWADKGKLQTFVMDGLTKTASETESDITRIKAMELLGKTRYCSIFENPQANEAESAVAGSLVDLIGARLQSLLGVQTPTLGDSETIDTTFDPVPPDATTPTDTPTGGGEGD
jgi:hypothetical protein